ncbi:alcohol dehydrogenase catalytic domain-containing protein [Paenibacillus oenotherae]|uniref:Alcohol dehydrogenase catalytic domain-containing protein n=1 Tax=Paenibacillus oenotherae TaxID=1435645 RepID=A0ABS7DAE3_9BACL|nr:alcohol dehydrogenase catalytic domain-containing protein [Paenibacillus oenotherae]MBW7476909.1 alcohol dehydrogenase catalytic domain-containing protein [Paenibacillus oenotherae]
MEALVWTTKNLLELDQREEPQIGSPTEVKIQIRLTGICGTDLAVITGKEEGVPDVIRGHEAVGIIVETGEQVTGLQVGDRVVIDPNQSCGECYFCGKDQPHLCLGTDGNGMVISGLNAPGTFAEYFVIDSRFVHRIPDSMSLEAAVLIEPLACVLHNFLEANVSQYDAVLVLGSGPMGILCQMVSKALRTRVTVATEPNPYRLGFSETIADVAITPDELTEEFVSGLLDGRKFDVIIDTVGNQLETADRWIDRGGRIVPFGINGTYKYTFSPTKYIQNGVRIIGAGEYRHMFGPALHLAGQMPGLEDLVTRKYKLGEYEKAIHELLGYDLKSRHRVESETIKTVFTP